uniref:Uncharacterized protein n=1 Tax=Petromyzon marinus TaxID=7757 RepID=S4RWM5_PETMA
ISGVKFEKVDYTDCPNHKWVCCIYCWPNFSRFEGG